MNPHYQVWKAVKNGNLPNLKVSQIACVDCNSRATEYDHRDYSKPLDVEPVCRSCNVARRWAKNMRYANYRSVKISAKSYRQLKAICRRDNRGIAMTLAILVDSYLARKAKEQEQAQ